MKCVPIAALLATIAALFAGCGDTGQHSLSVPLFARGQAPVAFAAGDWQVTLEDARVGIGPIYFCAASSSSGDLCPAAVAELTDSVTLNALEPARTRVGTLDALSVDARSAAWDFAITWPRTEQMPVVLDGAPEGHSAHFVGHAIKGSKTVRFVADLDLTPLLRGTHAVQGVNTRVSIDDATQCELRIDAMAWWSEVDFDQLAKSTTQPVIVTKGSPAYEALIVAMTSTLPPTLHWSER